MNCKNTRGCCSPCSALAQQLEETNTRAVAAYNLAETAMQRIDNLPVGGGSVQSVNGQLPDQDGDVTVDVGVKTVNSIAPDSDGDFTISAGTNVTITPTANGVEIEAEGGSPEVVSPLYIDGDGKIALKDWVLYDSTDWRIFVNDGEITEDIIIQLHANYCRDDVYLPKGSKTTQIPINSAYAGGFNMRIATQEIPFNNNATLSIPQHSISFPSLNQVYDAGTINERYPLTLNTTNLTVYKVTDPTSTSNGIRLYRRSP